MGILGRFKERRINRKLEKRYGPIPKRPIKEIPEPINELSKLREAAPAVNNLIHIIKNEKALRKDPFMQEFITELLGGKNSKGEVMRGAIPPEKVNDALAELNKLAALCNSAGAVERNIYKVMFYDAGGRVKYNPSTNDVIFSPTSKKGIKKMLFGRSTWFSKVSKEEIKDSKAEYKKAVSDFENAGGMKTAYALMAKYGSLLNKIPSTFSSPVKTFK